MVKISELSLASSHTTMINTISRFVTKLQVVVCLFVLSTTIILTSNPQAYAAPNQRGLIPMKNQGNVVSAQVILSSLSGARIGPDTSITAENVKQFTPSAETIAKATSFFREKGFEVGNCVGMSCSITGSAALFEKVLNVKVVIDDNNVASLTSSEGSKTTTLEGDTLKSLPDGLVDAITFPEPLDFGPGNY